MLADATPQPVPTGIEFIDTKGAYFHNIAAH
jgi:hypothetical protein